MSEAGGGSDRLVTRRGYLDWLRGVAVLVMIEAHVIDSWTRVSDRQSLVFFWSVILGGFGAPLFLFLAGVAIPLSAGSKFRRSGDARAATRAVVRRGLEIFGLAFLFRVQAWLISWGAAWTLLKVDILNIMGPSIAAAAACWGVARTNAGRLALFAALTIAMGFLTPIVRSLPGLAALPDPLEAYIRPIPALSNFVFMPWAGFVFAGAFIGVCLDAAQTSSVERRLNQRLFIAGALIALTAYALSFRPTLYAHSDFWTSSPAYFFLRVGIMSAAIAFAYWWEVRPRRTDGWSPLRQLGRTSLFIYWIHVEMVYGLISLPLHKGLSLTQAWIALVALCLLMLGCSVLKDRVVERYRLRSLRTG